jgi:hypothetical protein
MRDSRDESGFYTLRVFPVYFSAFLCVLCDFAVNEFDRLATSQ